MKNEVRNIHILKIQNVVSLGHMNISNLHKKLEDRPSHIFKNLGKTNSLKLFPFLMFEPKQL